MAAKPKPKMIGEKSTDGKLTLFDAQSLDAYFKTIETNEASAREKRIREEQEAAVRIEDKRNESRVRHLKEVTDLEALINTGTILKGVKLTVAQKKKLAQDLEKQELEADKKRVLEYYKRLSLQAQKEDKKKTKQLDKELKHYQKIAQLLSDTDEKNKEKTKKQKRIDNFNARVSEDAFKNNQMMTESMTKSLVEAPGRFLKAMEDISSSINQTITEYANTKGALDTRLQGSGQSYASVIKTLKPVSMSGLLSTQELYKNVQELTKMGITSNLEQRAMLMTMKELVVDTFDVNSKSLRQLIKVQQDDSTAARMGMEAYLNRFLNEYVKNTEYLTETFDSVADSLLTASSLMSASASSEFEFQVQKWLGTLAGVGFSDSAASSIAQAIGQLGSGNINALNSSNMQNLLVMGAGRANLSYADMLTEGLTADTTNKLMGGIVKYLREVASQGSNVVKAQLADVFGVGISDLQAVTNLKQEEIKLLTNTNMLYSEMYGELNSQFAGVKDRAGTAKVLENLFKNFQYSTGTNIASNSALYGMWKVTDLIQKVTGGINIPAISIMGNSVDLNTTVENLMKTGIIGISSLAGIGQIISGISSTFNGSNLLSALEIAEGSSMLTRGLENFDNKNKQQKRQSSVGISGSGAIGNLDSDAYYQSTLNAASDESKAIMNKGIDDAEDPTVSYLKDIQFKNQMEMITETMKDIQDKGLKVTGTVAIDKFNTGAIEGLTSSYRDAKAKG